MGDDASEFLARAGSRPDPFFMYLAFNAPHDPRQSPAEFVKMYPQEKVEVPANFPVALGDALPQHIGGQRLADRPVLHQGQ